MWSESILSRAGLGDSPADTRFAWRLLIVLLLLYSASFFAFYPDVAINYDESQFIRQARLMADGKAQFVTIDPLEDRTLEVFVSTYPPGTPGLMMPFIRLFGWKGGFLVPLLGLVLATFLTARWIQDEKRNPIYAVILLGFPPALVMGRVAMSDVPSAAIVALGLWLFWRGIERNALFWFASGYLAGSSTLFRVTNVLPFVPFYAGAVLRRETKCWALIAGGLAGLATRLLVMRLTFGEALFERSFYYFSPDTLDERLPLYAVGLLIFVPGGLLLGLAYKGRRRPEVLAAICLFVGFYLFQRYSSRDSGTSRRLILALRYFIPLLPVLAFAMAESTPRLWRQLRDRLAPTQRRLAEGALATTLAVWITGIAVVCVGVHYGFHRWGATQAAVRDAITEHTDPGKVLVSNLNGTRKFVPELDRLFMTLDRSETTVHDAAALSERFGGFYLALLYRSDSPYWRRDREQNEAFVASLGGKVRLTHDQQYGANDRLRIWWVSDVPAPGGPAPERRKRHYQSRGGL